MISVREYAMHYIYTKKREKHHFLLLYMKKPSIVVEPAREFLLSLTVNGLSILLERFRSAKIVLIDPSKYCWI
jgi:hypothetical protein